MSKLKSIDELMSHKSSVIELLDKYIDDLITSSDSVNKSKADKLSYWLEDYIKFLRFETSFDSSKFPKYKKGQIIKVHLGFNIGSEEGGLHYAVVVENNNPVHSPVLNIVPLTSIKSSTDISKIRPDLGQINLGNELHRLLSLKISTQKANLQKELAELKESLESNVSDDFNNEKIKMKLQECEKRIDAYARANNEINKMKLGSIALVKQITTISKIRIYDPKNTYGVLSGIRLSNETLDKIDSAICQMFTKNM